VNSLQGVVNVPGKEGNTNVVVVVVVVVWGTPATTPEDPVAAFATWRTPDHRAYYTLSSGEENAIVVAKLIKALHGSSSGSSSNIARMSYRSFLCSKYGVCRYALDRIKSKKP
jgi:hypothetical protein